MAKGKKRNKIRTVKILSQNVRGMKNDTRIEILLNVMKERNAIAVCLQETWRNGIELLEHDSFKILSVGLDKNTQQGNRGSQGVAIALNSDGEAAWKAGGYEMYTEFGARVMAVRLLMRDYQNRDIGVFLISAYAPIGNAPEEEWGLYFDQLSSCIAKKRQNDILLIGSDTNSSFGISPENEDPVGNFGISYINDSGRRFKSYLSINRLIAMTTYFKKNDYGTWIHPRSKKQHQIDHFIVNRDMTPRIRDAGVTACLLDSDHRALFVIVKIMKRLKKKSEPRSKMTRLDITALSNISTRNSLCENVVRNFNATDQKDLYSSLSESIKSACQRTLPNKTKNQPGWFQANSAKLLPLIQSRNLAMKMNFQRPTRSSAKRLNTARKRLKAMITKSKNDWILTHCTTLNRHHGTKPAWESLKSLKHGLSKPKPSVSRQMKKVDGSLCSTPQENATVFYEHFNHLYNREPNFDISTLDLIPHHEIVQGCDHDPTETEIKKAIQKLKNTAPGDSGIQPQIWKCLIDHPDTRQILTNTIISIWQSENIPEDWNIGRLTILPKKGDLGLPKNYRGIMLLETAYKIIAIIIHSRLLPIEESLDHEPQCGFRPDRGCLDAIFTVKTALRKRREHGKESWVFFLDLVKAFDRVPRQLLWLILEKFGVPPKLTSLLKSLHENFTVKFTIDNVTHIMTCTIGVKQGDILGPILFTFFLAAVMITWRATTDLPLCIFRSKQDAKMTGRSYRAYGEEYEFQDSEYADDTALVFDSREDASVGIPLCMNHFDRYGMEIHSGPPESKSVVLFCSKPPCMYDDPSTFDHADLSNIVFGERYIPIVLSFIYLGSVMSCDCSDDLDVDRRIQKACNAFGMIKSSLFSRTKIKLSVKAKVYVSFILSILLYGCECWSLTEKLLNKLRAFHHRCVRSICRVTLLDRKCTSDLLDKLSLESIDTYICRQQLRWAGHVMRMSWNRLPRKMLSCWVRSKRPRGAPRYTYGRSLNKCLNKSGIDPNFWHVLALNKLEWRKLINSVKI